MTCLHREIANSSRTTGSASGAANNDGKEHEIICLNDIDKVQIIISNKSFIVRTFTDWLFNRS